MVHMARQHARTDPAPMVQRALNLAARELLLAQSSDWAFIMKTGTASDYAWRRFHQHAGRFQKISEAIGAGQELDPRWLAAIEAADNLFPEIDFRVYA
jgi:1,4-alpha-glucan branching enzyme